MSSGMPCGSPIRPSVSCELSSRSRLGRLAKRRVVDTVRRGVPSENDLLLRSRLSLTGPLSRGIVLETIKRGEDDDFSSANAGEKTIIMRLYEGLGGRARGRLSL